MKEVKISRSSAGLREALFVAMDKLLEGSMAVETAVALAKVAHCIISSVNTQIEFERLRLASEIPASLPDMKLIPMIDKPKD